jgi:predicted ATP-dependent serine protease
MCYSGEAGIGKSTHFMNLAYTESKIRPALYFSFKFTGKDNNSFEEDIA